MQFSDKPENQTTATRPGPDLGKVGTPTPKSQGKTISDEHAARRLTAKGHWAAERKGKVRIVEFHEEPNGDSHSVTHWFNTWVEALEHYGMETTYRNECGNCGTRGEPEYLRTSNRQGQWICRECMREMGETANDLFVFCQGHWAHGL